MKRPSPSELAMRTKKHKVLNSEYESILQQLEINVPEIYFAWVRYTSRLGSKYKTLRYLKEFLESLWEEIGQCFLAHDKNYYIAVYKPFRELMARMKTPIHIKIIKWKQMPNDSVDGGHCNDVATLSEELDLLDLEYVDPTTGVGMTSKKRHFFGN